MCSTLATTRLPRTRWLGSVLTGTTDSPFCVVDLGSGFTVFGTKASVVAPGTISVQSAGITYHSSNGLHRKDPLSNDKRNSTSRGRISDAMVIRSDLVDYGIANNTDLGHVLHLFLVETRSSDGFRHPMVGCESGKHGFGAEGERIAHRPSGGPDEAEACHRRRWSSRALCSATAATSVTTRAASPRSRPSRRRRRTRCGTAGSAGDSLAGLRWDDFVVLRHA